MKRIIAAVLTAAVLIGAAPCAFADFSSVAWPGAVVETETAQESEQAQAKGLQGNFSITSDGFGFSSGGAQTGPYQSAKYPLPAKSLRKQGHTRYPEEKKLNTDPEKFKAVVDITNQVVKIYERDASGRYCVLVREMICSTGKEGFTTQAGVFQMADDYKRFAHFIHYGCYGQYWSLIHDNIYFHSLTYSKRDDRYLNEEDFYLLGSVASHGCVRLLPDDAHWVYLYLCTGSTVEITNDLPRDEALRARLTPTELPEPDCYQYQKKSVD